MCYSCNSFPSETFKFIKATILNRAVNSDSMLETYLITRGDVNKAVLQAANLMVMENPAKPPMPAWNLIAPLDQGHKLAAWSGNTQ